MPDISIIIPVFNTSEYLPKCLDSILAQTFTNWELLIVDDGSSDSSYEIMQEYAKEDGRVRIFHQGNAGVSSARNYGIQKAMGKWVTFVDSDDWLEREFLEMLWTNVEDVDFVLCGMNLINRNGSMRPAKFRTKIAPSTESDIYTLKEVYNSLNMYVFCGPCCKLFRKEIMDAHSVLFPKDLSFGEDSLFVARYLHHIRKIRLVDYSLYNVRSRPGSLCATNQSPALLLDTYRKVHSETLSFCLAQGIVDLSSQEAYYIDRLLFCSEKMRTSTDADSFRNERAFCYGYVYHSPHKKESGNQLTPLFYFCGALHWWRLYDYYLSMVSR